MLPAQAAYRQSMRILGLSYGKPLLTRQGFCYPILGAARMADYIATSNPM